MTPVIFRVWRQQPRSVFALFPAEPSDYDGLSCSSYEHIGQHGAADYTGCMARSRPATPREYRDLMAELRSYGDGTPYADLVVYSRRTEKHRAAFNRAVREIRP